MEGKAICMWCGKEFEITGRRTRFCCKEHYRKYYNNKTRDKKDRPKRYCEICGKDVTYEHGNVMTCKKCREKNCGR